MMKKLSPEKVKKGKEILAKLAQAMSPKPNFRTLVYAKYDVVDLTKHPKFGQPRKELDPRKRFLELQKKSKKADIIPFEKKAIKQPVSTPAPSKKIKPDPKKDKELVDELMDLLRHEHLSLCEDNTCDINYSAQEGFDYWALELFSGSGAASDEFEELYNQLSPAFFKEAEKERKELLKQPFVECPHCNAYTWGVTKKQAKEENWICDDCGKPLGSGARA